MQITFLVHDIHFGGGGERVTANMANHFAGKGDQVSIVSISRPKTGNIFSTDKRVSIIYLNIDLNSGIKVIPKIKSVFAVKKYFKGIAHQTFLLGIGTYPTILVALLPSDGLTIKIGCQHGSYASVRNIWYLMRWLLYRRLNALVSLTNYDVPKLQKLNKKVSVIPNSLSFFPDQPAELCNKTILSIGRIDYPKGYDLLLEVYSRFCTINKEWQLRIIGDGPLKEKLKTIIADKNLNDRISIISSTDNIMEEYLKASIYLMTSRTEGLPMVLLEAQACGLPIVAFNCQTGPSDIVSNGVDGYLIDDYNIEEMESKLTELCNDANKRMQFGQNARLNSKRFFPEQIFNQWETLFNQLL